MAQHLPSASVCFCFVLALFRSATYGADGGSLNSCEIPHRRACIPSPSSYDSVLTWGHGADPLLHCSAGEGARHSALRVVPHPVLTAGRLGTGSLYRLVHCSRTICTGGWQRCSCCTSGRRRNGLHSSPTRRHLDESHGLLMLHAFTVYWQIGLSELAPIGTVQDLFVRLSH